MLNDCINVKEKINKKTIMENVKHSYHSDGTCLDYKEPKEQFEEEAERIFTKYFGKA